MGAITNIAIIRFRCLLWRKKWVAKDQYYILLLWTNETFQKWLIRFICIYKGCVKTNITDGFTFTFLSARLAIKARTFLVQIFLSLIFLSVWKKSMCAGLGLPDTPLLYRVRVCNFLVKLFRWTSFFLISRPIEFSFLSFFSFSPWVLQTVLWKVLFSKYLGDTPKFLFSCHKN